MGEIYIPYDPELQECLEKNEKVKKLVKCGDISLKIIVSPVTIQRNPGDCFNITDNCVYFFNKAKKMTEEPLIIEYCNKRIREIYEARQHIGSRLPITDLDKLLREINQNFPPPNSV